MFKALLTDSTLFIYTLCIWGAGCFLFSLTYLVFVLQGGGTDSSEPMMWLITIPLWFLLFYTYCEFCFIVIEHGAHGYSEFPVMQLTHFGVFSGPKKLLGVACVFALVWGAYAKLGSPGADLLLVLLYFYLAFFTPAILISVAMQGSAWAALNPMNVLRTAFEVGVKYLGLVFVGALLILFCHFAFEYRSAITLLYSFCLLWLINAYVFWLGCIAREHVSGLGFVADIDNQTPYQQAVLEAEKELNILGPHLFQLSTKNRIANGIVQLEAYVAKYEAMGVEAVDLWLNVWARIQDWNDWVFLEAVAQRLTHNQIKRSLFGDAWQYAQPFFERDGFFPFKNAQDCLNLCRSGVPILPAKKAQVLTIAAKHFATELVKPHILLLLAQVYYFELANDKKTHNIVNYLDAHYPELVQEKAFAHFIAVVHGRGG